MKKNERVSGRGKPTETRPPLSSVPAPLTLALPQQARTAAWLGSVDRTDRLLLTFARHLDQLLEHAREARRPIRPQDAAMALLRAAADEEAAERRQQRLAA